MKKRNILVYSLFMFFLSLLTLEVVAHALTGNGYLPAMPRLFNQAPQQTVADSFRCSPQAPIKGLDQAKDPQLRKLAKYQDLCHSRVTTKVMIFNNMPKDNVEAANNARQMSATLKEFNKFGVTPIVATEPVASWGDVDFQEFKAGFYDQWLATYFQAIKSQGITDQEMGIWVPFPEANLPYWNRNNATPGDFAAIVNKYLTIAQQSFPRLQGSVLLNSATYNANDFNWANGEYVSLVPYVKDLNKNLVQSFGMEGFPWKPPANESGPGIFDASQFLNYKLAQEAADAMGTRKIWFNTGTFASKYDGDPTRQTYVSPEQRVDVLNGILAQANQLKSRGYDISINLFAQDKSHATEATDWSYFNDSNVMTSSASPAFANFASRLNQARIDLWLFDREAQ
jgi:hypothetical protein